MDAETAMWIVCGLMALGGAISFAGRLGMWAVFHYGAKGKLKVLVFLSDEKDEN